MARYITTNVVTEVLETEGGYWCRECALPSVWVEWVVLRTVRQMLFLVRPWCDECGRRDTADLRSKS